MRRRSILRILALPVVLLMTLIMLPAASAEGYDSWIDESLIPGSSDPYYVGGEYSWGLQQISPMADPTTTPVTVTFEWGDGSSTETSTTGGDPRVECYQEEGQWWQCGIWAGHAYAHQGLYSITATAAQAGNADCTASVDAVVYDLDVGGSVKASGTLEARTGGMYDRDFVSGTATFSLTASRRSGSASTKAVLRVSVPSMEPDWPEGTDDTGLVFTSKATTRPLYVENLGGRGNHEVFIERIFGTITNTGTTRATGYATFHAIVERGQTTLVRISIWNTSMGFTYVDTAMPPADSEVGPWQGYLELNPVTDKLQSGSIRVS